MLCAALGHVVDFEAWRSLTGKARLTRSETVELTVRTFAAIQRRPRDRLARAGKELEA
jgi:hypothetical protein